MTPLGRLAAALGAAGLAALPLPAAAGPLAPTKPSQLVTVWTVGAACSNDVPADGVDPARFNTMRTLAAAEAPFAVPAKQVLLITRAEISLGGADANERVSILLIGVGGTSPGLLAETRVTAAADGGASALFEFPTPVAVRGDTELCVTTSHGAVLGSLTGFFAKDR